MSASSQIFGFSGNVVRLVLQLLHSGGMLGNPIISISVQIILKIVINPNVLSVIFLLICDPPYENVSYYTWQFG